MQQERGVVRAQGTFADLIVVGETAAPQISLSTATRVRNPRLSQIPGLINFPQAYSCGTDTALSLPCMFSNSGRAKFDANRAARQENLLDVVQRAGFAVRWHENQSGCKGVCLRVPTEVLVEAKPRRFYEVADALDKLSCAIYRIGSERWIGMGCSYCI